MRQVTKIPIKHHPSDLYFRVNTIDLIDKARKEIRVVTGEFSILYFSDVLEAFREAIQNRNVTVEAYLGRCDVDTTNLAIVNNMIVYSGKKMPESGNHYMIVDRKHIIVSEKHVPYSVGERHGYVVQDNEKFAANWLTEFDSLKKKVKKPSTKLIDYRKKSRELIASIYN